MMWGRKPCSATEKLTTIPSFAPYLSMYGWRNPACSTQYKHSTDTVQKINGPIIGAKIKWYFYPWTKMMKTDARLEHINIMVSDDSDYFYPHFTSKGRQGNSLLYGWINCYNAFILHHKIFTKCHFFFASSVSFTIKLQTEVAVILSSFSPDSDVSCIPLWRHGYPSQAH